MKNIGNIKVGLLCPRFQVNIEYSTPENIDLFSLLLMDLISHKSKYKKERFEDLLLGMGIPKDLINIFEERVKNLSPRFISSTVLDLRYPIDLFDLTEDGTKALRSKELPIQIKKEQVIVVYNNYENKFKLEHQSKKADEEKSIIISSSYDVNEDEMKKMLESEVNSHIKTYISDANERTKVYSLSYVPLIPFPVNENITISINEGNVEFKHENIDILNAFKNADKETKLSIKDKMFNYYNFDSKNIKVSNATLAFSLPLFKSAFVSKTAISKELNLKNYYLDPTMEYHACGLDENNFPTMYSYCEKIVDGYPIPLEEKNHIDALYKDEYEKMEPLLLKDVLKNNLIDNDKLMLLLSLTIKKEKNTEFKKIISKLSTSFGSIMNELNKLYDNYRNNRDYSTIIEDYAYTVIKENIKAEKIKIDELFEFKDQFNFSVTQVFELVKDNYGNEDYIINKMLALNEDKTFEAYGLKGIYNKALIEGNIDKYSHKSKAYPLFLNYSNQIKLMNKKYGYESFFKYKLPEDDWQPFLDDVKKLQKLYNDVSMYLTDENKMGSEDFFISINDMYLDLMPKNINIEGIIENSGDFEKDVQKAINSPSTYFEGVAAIIRHNYSEVLHYLEETKDSKYKLANRCGYNLIKFALGDKLKDNQIKEIYTHWRNLCILVHSDTEKNSTLVKAPDKEKRKALMKSLVCYSSYLKKYSK